jgi:hypothetical protein
MRRGMRRILMMMMRKIARRRGLVLLPLALASSALHHSQA